MGFCAFVSLFFVCLSVCGFGVFLLVCFGFGGFVKFGLCFKSTFLSPLPGEFLCVLNRKRKW